MLHLTIISLWISARFCHLTCPNDSRDSEWNKSLSTILHTFKCYKGPWDIKTGLGLDHLQWCSVCDPAKRFLESKFGYLPFSNPTQKTKTGTANRWETTNSNPPGLIKLSSQSTAGVRFCCAFYQPQHPVQKCWAKTIVLSQTSMFWLFFIQFSFAGPHTEHQWSYFYMLLLKEGR